MKPITGTTLYSITPVDADGAIDIDVWSDHLDWALGEGVHSITLFGSTGGNGYFSEAEKTSALSALVPKFKGRAPIMVGIGAMTTAETCRVARHCADLGVDAVLVVPLNYWRPTERELIAHYKAVADATDLPLWAYNNPPLAGIDITPTLMAKLSAEIPKLVGAKESSGDLTRVFTIPKLTNGRVAVGLGQDTTPLEALAGSAPAWFTGLANFRPRECAELWNKARAGDLGGALELTRALFALGEFGSRHGIIRVAHTALQLMGRPVNGPRKPLMNLAGGEEAALAALLKTSA